MLRYFAIFILLAFHLLAPAQTTFIDQHVKNLYAAGNNNEKLQELLMLCSVHESLHKDSLFKYANIAAGLAALQQEDWKKTDAQIARINALIRLGNTDSALILIEPELKKNTVTNPASRKKYFKLAAQKVDCFGDKSNYTTALAELYKIIVDAEKYNDSLVLAKNCNTIGVIQYNLDHISEAFKWYFKGLMYCQATPEFAAVSGAINVNIAETYRWIENTDSANYFIDKAITLCTQSQNLFFLANALRVKASIYKQQKQYDKAEETMMQCIALREKLEGRLTFSNEQIALANIYMNAGNYDKSISILTNALSQDQQNNKVDALKISYYRSLAKCYKQKGDNVNYTKTLEKIIEAKDTFYEENSAHAIAELQTKYEVQKKESTIIQQKLDLTKKNYLFYGSLILIAFAMAVAWLLFKNYRRKQKLAINKMVYEEKMLAALAVKEAEENERKRIAADLHDNLGAYAASIASNLDQISLGEVSQTWVVPLQQLRNNSQAIVSQLGDTIWALKKDALALTAISDRLKAFIQRIQPSYPMVNMEVLENISNDMLLTPAQAFHLFSILRESIINALRHSHCKNIIVKIEGATHWYFTVSDDGDGIDMQKIVSSNNGLANMQRRAKEFDWQIKWQLQNPGTIIHIYPTTK